MLKLFTGSAGVRLAGAAAQLALTVFVARSSSPAQAGIFFFAYSMMFILSTLVRMGCEMSALPAASSHFAEARYDRLRVVADTRIMLVLALGLSVSIGVVLVARGLAEATFGTPARAPLVLLGLAIPPMALIGLLSELLKAVRRPIAALAMQNLAVPAVTVLLLVGIDVVLPVDASIMTGVFALTATLTSLFMWFVWRKVGFPPGARADIVPSYRGQELLRILRQAPALLVVSTTSVAMQWMGAVLIGFFAPAAQVATYSVAMRISIAVSVIHSAAASIVGPQMAVAYSRKRIDDLTRVSHRTALMISAVTWPILVIIFVAATPILGLFGKQYFAGAEILRILVLGQVFAAFMGHSGTVLVMCGKYGSARTTSMIAGSTLIVLSLALIPTLDGLGAAISMSAAVVAGHSAAAILANRVIGVRTVPASRGDLIDLRRPA